MNGYVKMKRLRRMRVTKIISAVTALSMTVTGLAVATSANSASPNAISNALGDLSDYGIVAESMTTNSHFESNYAVKNLTLNNNYDVSKFVSGKSRTISLSVTSEESFAEGSVIHLLGVYANGECINVEYQGQITSGLIAVDFSEPGTKTFDITIPNEYKYETISIHKMALEVYEDEGGPYTALVFDDEGAQFYPHAVDEYDALIKNSQSIVSDTMNVGGEMFGTDKTIFVGSEIYSTLKFESDGRISGLKPRVEWVTDPETGKAAPQPVYDEEGNQIYDTTIIANNTNKFYEMSNASEEVDRLVSYIKTASDNLAAINSGSVEDKVLYERINGSIYCGSEEAQRILDDYTFIKNNPSYSMLVNVYLEEGENSYVFNSGAIGDWDADASSRIVFNFIGGLGADRTHITLGDGFRGVVVAPNARVSNSATICGAVYAPEYVVSSGELHMATYRAFNDSYQAYYYDEVVETTTEETTPEETTTEETTTEETTTEETTTEETTTEETTTEETTTEVTTTEATTTEVTTTEETTTPETEPVTTPPATEPETEPVTTPPETEPVTTPPATEPVTTTTPATEPVTTPPATEPVTTPPVTEPVTTPPATEPVTTPPVTEPVTTPPVTEPVTTPPVTEPVTTTTTATEPVTTTTTATEPVTTTTTATEPVTTTTTATEPVTTTTTATEPVTTTTTATEPVTTTSTTEPVTEPVTTPPETTTEETTTEVTTTEEAITSEATTTETVPPEETTAETTPEETYEYTTTPEETYEYSTPEETTTVTEDIETSEATTLPPAETTTVPPETSTTTTVPVTFPIEENVPRDILELIEEEVPRNDLILIDEEVPLGDMPMNTGVESNIGIFAIIGGAALMVGAGAQFYSVILRKKH